MIKHDKRITYIYVATAILALVSGGLADIPVRIQIIQYVGGLEAIYLFFGVVLSIALPICALLIAYWNYSKKSERLISGFASILFVCTQPLQWLMSTIPSITDLRTFSINPSGFNDFLSYLTTICLWAATYAGLSPEIRKLRPQSHNEAELEKERERLANDPAVSDKDAKRKLKAMAAEQNLKALNAKIENYGDIVARGTIGTSGVYIYSKGYVEVTGMLTAMAPTRLLGISSSVNVKKKNLAGRTLGSAVTLGANVVFSPGTKGSAYLTLVTESGTQVISTSMPRESDVRSIMTLEAAGQAVIDMAQEPRTSKASKSKSSPTKTKPKAKDDIAVALKRLSKLHKDGELTAKEYAAAKKKLLG